jgi:hypothetical protein
LCVLIVNVAKISITEIRQCCKFGKMIENDDNFGGDVEERRHIFGFEFY